jgi:ABC-2 type transport system ATP-binding protein
MLCVQDLCLSIGGRQILDHITFSVKAGEVYGCIGANGAGKTTTMLCILGLKKVSSGSIVLLGGNPEDMNIKRRIGFCPESVYWYRSVSGRELLRLCGRLSGISTALLESRIAEVLEQVHMTYAADRLLRTYSKGMLQRIGLAQSLVHNPEIIFLDEPMSGLDPLGRKLVREIILHLKSQGKTIFFNTHILSDVEEICDRCCIIHGGRLMQEIDIHTKHAPLEDIFLDTVQAS